MDDNAHLDVPVAAPDGAPAPAAAPAAGPRWVTFALLCAAYFATTTGEQMLSPLFPIVSDDLGLSVTQGGIAFAVLTGTIAVTNLIGGDAVRHATPRTVIQLACAAGVAGSIVNALTTSYAVLLVGQVLLGAAAGLFFPLGLQGVGIAAGPAKRGFAMGIYGVAFSGGLLAAALLGTLGAAASWRLPFWIAAAMFVAAGVAIVFADLGPRVRGPRGKLPLREVLTLPTYVGIVLATLQYGAIPFLTTYAVTRWKISAAEAATVLVVGRLISIVAKVIGGATADRIGARASGQRTALVLTATGLAWVLLPGHPVTYGIAALFAGAVSSLGPVANMLAVESFGSNGLALGLYRSVQIALGAVASALVGVAAGLFGLRPTLAVAGLVPLALLWICRDPQTQGG
ncbi:MAG TPA: MFS transporter [Ilumatobacter sp.]|nr:MFS transporter [Ilumatobacter sp.]